MNEWRLGKVTGWRLQPCPNRADLHGVSVKAHSATDSCSDKYSRSALTLELRSGTLKCSMGRFFNNNITFVNCEQVTLKVVFI